MTLDRRRFVFGSLAAGLAAACGSHKDAPPAIAAPAPAPQPAAPAPKKTILILGGTGFLGPHVVDAALARGHTVTLFNRGKTHPELFPERREAAGRSRRQARGAQGPNVGRGRRHLGATSRAS